MSHRHRIAPRRVAAGWSRTSLHRIPGDPTATHSVQHTHVADHSAAQRLDTADGLDHADVDEVMLGLLRRHGAEEGEHRAVAFGMYQHCGGTGAPRCARRAAGTAVTAPVMPYLWVWGAACSMRHDPESAGRPCRSRKEHEKTVRKGPLPSWRELGAVVPRCLRRPCRPSHEGSSSRAVEYLKRSPAAKAAS